MFRANMLRARWLGGRKRYYGAGGQSGEAAEGQQQGPQEKDEGAGARRLPRRMPQWRTGNPNNSGIAGGVMERLEERWQEQRRRDKEKGK